MKLFHTSPAEIIAINKLGRFGEFLFFSDDVYVMTADEHIVYSVEINDSDIIEAGQIFYHDDAAKLDALVAELAAKLDVDTDVAESLIDESSSVFDLDHIEPEDAADASWDVQLYTARAAKILGFRGAQVEDEQGAAYMIDMLGFENDLVKE